MKQYYDEMKDLLCPDLISKAARVVDEKETNVKTASNTIIAGLLGILLKKGNTQYIEEILREAGNLDILSDLGNICEERVTKNQRRIGDDFLQTLLGDRAADFTEPVATYSDISKVATNRLTAIIAPMVAGFLGEKMVKQNLNMPQLLNELDSQKNDFAGVIPAGLAKSFDLHSVLNGKNAKYTTKTTDNTVRTAPATQKKGKSWITWVIIIVLVLLLLIWWRSCSRSNRDVYTARNNNTAIERSNRPMTTATAYNAANRDNTANRANTVPVQTTTTSRNAMNTSTNSDAAGVSSVSNVSANIMELTLLDGTKIRVNRGGTEEEMMRFLESNDYRNANDSDLKKKWFAFDKINFEFNSGTKLMDGSQEQIDNIISILKNHRDAKVKIAGFADRKGGEDVNMDISKERAKTIERMLERGGVGSQVVRTEGYGDEFATRSANAPDSERAKDRDIALRFVK